jgi:hypothetical protein
VTHRLPAQLYNLNDLSKCKNKTTTKKDYFLEKTAALFSHKTVPCTVTDFNFEKHFYTNIYIIGYVK